MKVWRKVEGGGEGNGNEAQLREDIQDVRQARGRTGSRVKPGSEAVLVPASQTFPSLLMHFWTLSPLTLLH